MEKKNLKYNEINGILLIDKPLGITSNKALQNVKHLFKAKKAGHTGSLDPLATGMLPICFGEATKFSQFLLDSDKCYEATGLLGVTTTTADSTGEITKQCQSDITEQQLRNTLEKFTGEVSQIPSMYSALKHKGQPLYKYARVGKEIERKKRTIFIQKLELLHFSEQKFNIKVECTKGTYIRNLVEDIGNFLGVGAHVIQLRRIYSANFANEKMYTMKELEELEEENLKELLLPIDMAIHNLPKLLLSTSELLDLKNGKHLNHITNEIDGIVRLYQADDNIFLGTGVIENGQLKPLRLLSSTFFSKYVSL